MRTKRISMMIFYLLTTVFFMSTISAGVCFGAVPQNYNKILFIVMDGAQNAAVNELFDEGKLFHMSRLRDEGSFARIMITSHYTVTDASYATMLTGYGGGITGVESNSYDIVPDGYTIFERLKSLRPRFKTGWISGRHSDKDPQGYGDNNHKDHGFPTVTFQNVINGEELNAYLDPYYSYHNTYWGGFSSGFIYPDDFFVEEGEIYHVKSIAVGDKAVEQINAVREFNFFLVINFTNPDLAGHLYGENSDEYKDSIVRIDKEIGKIVYALKDIKNNGAGNIYDDTAIIVATDHGYIEGGTQHFSYPMGAEEEPPDPDCYKTWMINNKVTLQSSPDIVTGIQVDIAATIYGLLGVDTSDFNLRDGEGLIAKPIWERE